MSAIVRVEEKLGVNKFYVDEESAHITIDKSYANKKEIRMLVQVCPAGLYKIDDAGALIFDYAGCLECGTCRILSLGKAISSWGYPTGGMGVEFRIG